MTLRLNGSTSGYTEIDAPAAAGNNTLVLPTGNGSAGQALVTNGSGVLSWAQAGGPSLYYRLASDFVGANVTTTQSLLGVGVTVESGCLYQFTGYFYLTKTAGTTIHAARTLFGGTATISAIEYQVDGNIGASFSSTGYLAAFRQTASVVTVTQDFSGATSNALITMQGSVSFSAVGTFIPQYQLTAAPGGAYSTKVGSFFAMTKLSATGANSSGTWS